MKRKLSPIAVLLLTCCVASAQPSMSVTNLGANVDGNFIWNIAIAPDAELFGETRIGIGGSLAAELAFTVDGSEFLSATVNSNVWPFANPGNNPFSETISEGISLGSGEAFLAIGSEILTVDEPVDVATLITQGTHLTTLNWGGQTVLAGTPSEYVSSRIAQGGRNYDGITGSLNRFIPTNPLDCSGDGLVTGIDVTCATNQTIGDTLAEAGFLAGDFDLNGDVSFADFLVLSSNFGNEVDGYAAGDADLNGNVEFSDFLQLSGNFGNTFGAVANVPEPTCSYMLFASALLAVRNRSHVRSATNCSGRARATR